MSIGFIVSGFSKSNLSNSRRNNSLSLYGLTLSELYQGKFTAFNALM